MKSNIDALDIIYLVKPSTDNWLAFISSRYPNEVERFEEEYDIVRCQQLFSDVEVIIKWLKGLLEKN